MADEQKSGGTVCSIQLLTNVSHMALQTFHYTHTYMHMHMHSFWLKTIVELALSDNDITGTIPIAFAGFFGMGESVHNWHCPTGHRCFSIALEGTNNMASFFLLLLPSLSVSVVNSCECFSLSCVVLHLSLFPPCIIRSITSCPTIGPKQSVFILTECDSQGRFPT